MLEYSKVQTSFDIQSAYVPGRLFNQLKGHVEILMRTN